MSLSLAGVRVLELARYQAGPRGGMILPDLGAEVIKIERPAARKPASIRRWCAVRASYFSVYNRGKRSTPPRSSPSAVIFAGRRKTADIVLETLAGHRCGDGLRLRKAAA